MDFWSACAPREGKGQFPGAEKREEKNFPHKTNASKGQPRFEESFFGIFKKRKGF